MDHIDEALKVLHIWGTGMQSMVQEKQAINK